MYLNKPIIIINMGKLIYIEATPIHKSVYCRLISYNNLKLNYILLTL